MPTAISRASLRHRDFWLHHAGDLREAARSLSDTLRAAGAAEPRSEHDADVLVDLPPGTARRLVAVTRREPLLLWASLAAAAGLVLRRFGVGDHVVLLHDERGTGALPVLLEPRPDSSFRDWLAAVRTAVTEATGHDAADDATLRALRRDLGGRTALPLSVRTGPPEGDLDGLVVWIDAVPRSGPAAATVHVGSRVVPRPLLGRLARGVVTVLTEGLDAPERPLADIAVLDPAAQRQVLVEFHRTALLPAGLPYRELLLAQAAAHPDAVAVHDSVDSITYGQLCSYATSIALRLRAEGAGAGTPVALAVPRSAWFIVAAVGILFAGSAYVPVDAAMPTGRRRQLLDHTELMIVGDDEGAPERGGPARLALTRLRDRAESSPTAVPTSAEVQEALGDAPQPDDLAYVIFTSGSTGTPKGACLEHHSFLNLLATRVRDHGLRPGAEVPQTAPLSFDLSIWQMFAGLTAGATVCVVPDDVARDPALLIEMIIEHRYECLAIVPTLLAVLLDQLEDDPASAVAVRNQLRQLISTGELLAPGLARRWHATMPGVALLNAYGPAEVTDDSTGGPVTADEGTCTTIGRVLPNVRLYVLDRDLQLVPPGITGEIYIGGESVGRGYLGRPRLTAASFIPDPFSRAPGRHMYRTGDRGRWRPDGNVELLGRNDNQVKVRGRRVELGEIEHVLDSGPDVAKAVVELIADGGVERLVAFVVPAAGTRPVPAEILRSAADQLPDYMVPTQVLLLGILPRSRNGKVDRAALKALAREDTGPVADRAAPRSETERVLCTIWERLLGCAGVGVHDDFFDLGGDSIVGIRAAQEARRRGIPLRPHHIPRERTIERLAALVGAPVGEATGPDAPPGTGPDTGRTGTAPLTAAQSAFLARGLPRPNHWNQSVRYGLQGHVATSAVVNALSALADRHPVLRTRFDDDAAGPCQRIAPSGEGVALPTEEFDLRAAGPARARARVPELADRLHEGLDLRRGPVGRAALFRMPGSVADELLVVVHHAVVDLFSWTVLTEDLASLLRGGSAVLPAPEETSYLAWARRLHSYARTGVSPHDVDHWSSQDWHGCTGLIPAGPYGTERNTGEVVATLDGDRTRRLFSSARAAATTVHERLVAVLGAALQRWTGEPGRNVLVELGGHGREDLFDDLDISRTVGFFNSAYPFVLPTPGRAAFAPYAAVVATLLRSVPRHGFDFEVLAHLRPDDEVRSRMREIPTPQVLFNYWGDPAFLAPRQDVAGTGPLGAATVDATGNDRFPDAPRAFPLEIYAALSQGRLTVRWRYSGDVLDASRVALLADAFTDIARTTADAGDSTERVR